jgi:ankyrin repeat protein
MTGEYWQEYGQTALLWASVYGHADTARVLVELGASVEAVDKVNIHSHELENTCCMEDV